MKSRPQTVKKPLNKHVIASQSSDRFAMTVFSFILLLMRQRLFSLGITADKVQWEVVQFMANILFREHWKMYHPNTSSLISTCGIWGCRISVDLPLIFPRLPQKGRKRGTGKFRSPLALQYIESVSNRADHPMALDDRPDNSPAIVSGHCPPYLK